MKRAPWLAVPIGTVDGLICIFEKGPLPWPREAAALDLARHLDLASSGRTHTFPSRRTLAARWGWTEATVRGLLVSRHEWSDPTKQSGEPAIRPTLAQRSPKGRPAETVAPAQSAAVSPNARPELTQRSPSIRPDVLPDSLENVAFEYGLSEVGTMGDTTHSHNHNPQNTHEPARDDEPPNESDHMPTNHLGSRPTMDADPIDNDGEDTSPPFRAAPSPLTDFERPATSDTSAPAGLLASGLLILPAGAPIPAKPKRKAKAETEAQRKKRERAEQAAAEAETMIAAWGLACQSYDTISGKMRRWDPAKGDGRLIAETMAKEGQARIVARFAQAARDPWCLDKRPDLAALCRGTTPFVSRLDAAAEQATLDAESRSDAVAASGGMLTHASAQNAPERQPAPKQTTSWPDVLRDLGSDPDHHPEDGPHRKHWPRLREAIYSATKSSGDAWKTWCLADETKRQRVERVLSLVTA